MKTVILLVILAGTIVYGIGQTQARTCKSATNTAEVICGVSDIANIYDSTKNQSVFKFTGNICFKALDAAAAICRN